MLAGQGAEMDTAIASGKLVFGVFAALAEFERELIRERTKAGLAAARARGRKGGRRFDLSKAQVRLALVAIQNRDTEMSELCEELGVTRSTLYRHVGPRGELREHVAARFERLHPGEVGMSMITYGEFLLAAEKSQHPEQAAERKDRRFNRITDGMTATIPP